METPLNRAERRGHQGTRAHRQVLRTHLPITPANGSSQHSRWSQSWAAPVGVRNVPPHDHRHHHRSAAAELVAREIVVGSAERERTGTPLIPQLRQVADAGLLGNSVLEYGGPGLPASTTVEDVRRLSRGDGAVVQLLLAHFVIARAIAGLGRQDPAPRIYGDALAGAQLGNASAERGTKHALDRRTTVSQQADGTWVLNGTKYYATGALGAAWIAVAAGIPESDETATVFARISRASC